MPDNNWRLLAIVGWGVVLVLSISVAAPGLVGGSPHVEEHSHHNKDHGSRYTPPNQTNATVYLYASESKPPTFNAHAPEQGEVSKWSESIIAPNGHPNPHADEDAIWLKRLNSFTFQASACELPNLRTFSTENADEDNPPSNGTGGPGDRGNYASWEGEIQSVDTNHERDNSGFKGSNAWDIYETYLSNEGGEEVFPLAWGADGRRDDYFIDSSETMFWTPEQSKNNESRKPFDLTSWDRVVVDWADCFTNPATPGWYRQGSWSEVYWNGTGDTPEEAVRHLASNNTSSISHWTYICECESYDEAVSTLGAPPGFSPGDKDPVATRPSWIEPSGGGDGDDTPTPTDTQTPAGTTIPGTDTPTPTPEGTTVPPDEDTPTPTPAGTTVPPDEDTQTATPEGGSTDTPGDDTSQPGFGVIVAVLALLGAALMARRRA